MVLHHPKTRTATDGLRMRETARRSRVLADNVASRDPTGARWNRLEAADADRIADEILTLPEKPAIGAGGELHLSRADACEKPGLACTVEEPDLVTVEASRDRLELAADVQCLALATDTADTIRARDSLEKMLAHELAAAHRLAMTFAGKSHQFLGHVTSWNGPARQQLQSIEAARLAAAAARMMDTFQRGLLTLDRLRNGGRQVVTVQHVTVGEGGQAIVAGTVKGGGRRRGAS